MGKSLLVASTLLIMPFPAAGQALAVDPGRDLALQTTVQGFLDGTLTANQLETHLRTYVREFEAKPYKIRTAKIEWAKVPQERVVAFARVSVRITGPVMEAFFRGELTAPQAALKIAPFFLLGPGYGMDPPNSDPLSRQRTDELLSEIHAFAGAE